MLNGWRPTLVNELWMTKEGSKKAKGCSEERSDDMTGLRGKTLLSMKVEGKKREDQGSGPGGPVKSFDWKVRKAEFIERADTGVFDEGPIDCSSLGGWPPPGIRERLDRS